MTPGPDTLYVIARSFGQGRMAGIISALGICAGTLVHTLAAAVGLSALLMTSALAYNVVKYAGAAYLIYLGVRVLLSRQGDASLGTLPQAGLATSFFQAALTNVLNPKVALFFLAFLPQFVTPAQGKVAWQIITLGVIFIIITILWLTLVALLTRSLGDCLRNRPGFVRFQRWFTGGIFVALGTRLALPEQR